MRLVLATPLYPPEPGGPSTYARMLAELLPREDVQVKVVKFSGVRHLPPVIRHYSYFSKVRKAAREADCIIALDPVSTGLPAALAALSLGKPLALKIVGDYAWEQGKQRFGITVSLDEFVKRKYVPFMVWVLRMVERFVAHRAKAIIVPSEYLKGIVMTWGIQSEKITVINNAIQLEEIGNVPALIDALPRPRIVSVGRLVSWKHMDGIMDAVKLLGRGSLTIVGNGPEQDRLEAHARSVFPQTVFPGALPNSEVLAIIRDADVFVLNSSYEGLSHLLIEALSLGTPIVATDVGGNPEVVTKEADGVLVPVGDTAALAEGIRTILARKRGTKPEANVIRFSPRTMATSTAALLKSVV